MDTGRVLPRVGPLFATPLTVLQLVAFLLFPVSSAVSWQLTGVQGGGHVLSPRSHKCRG